MAFKERYGPAAIVTGASSGIGWAFAEELAARGFDLVLVARRVDRLNALAKKLVDQHDVRAGALQMDLSAPEAAEQILLATAELDVGLVVSNAGFGLKGDHADNDPQAMTEMLMVNCHAPMQLTHGFMPRLRRRGCGGIILTSSVEGLMGMPYSAAYSATKAFVIGLGESLWAELQPDGVDVLTLCPGATESEAAAKQGIDMSTMSDVMPAAECARLALDNIAEGPTYISGDVHRARFEQLLALPRRQALTATAQAMRRFANKGDGTCI